jgi:spore maturation protein CgeB
MPLKILIAGESGNHCLEMAYFDAFRSLGHHVELFDTKEAVIRHARGGKIGYEVHRFIPIDAWIKKANKDLANFTRSFQPDILMVFTGAEILPGTLAYIKSILPTRIIWYWADPLPNLSRYIQQGLVLADLVASYSHASLTAFEMMGARRTAWVPFAGDLAAHFMESAVKTTYKYDLGFIGSWRPEREAILRAVYEHFPRLRLKVSGPYWSRCSFAPLRRLAEKKPVYGKVFSGIVQDSLLQLNVMDDTNFPAVNMRFFEILAAGGLELCSAAPEMKDTFIDRQHILYFSNQEELKDQIQFAMERNNEREAIKINGQKLLLSGHLYTHRANSITQLIESVL